MLYKVKKDRQDLVWWNTFNEKFEVNIGPIYKVGIASNSIVLFLNEAKRVSFCTELYKVLHIDRIVWVIKDILEPVNNINAL